MWNNELLYKSRVDSERKLLGVGGDNSDSKSRLFGSPAQQTMQRDSRDVKMDLDTLSNALAGKDGKLDSTKLKKLISIMRYRCD